MNDRDRSRSTIAPPSPAGLAVACRDVSFAYDEGQRRVPALDGVSFELPAGVSAALLGPTGAGKSTLLQVLRGLLDPAPGEVLLSGDGPASPAYESRRREIGLVFQVPEVQLFAATAIDDVAFGPRQLGWPPDEVGEAARRALELVGLPAERFGRRHPHSLSGGEQRRLALAGVLAMRPRLLLLDEPFVSLDPGARRDLSEVLRGLRAGGVGLVLATHDLDEAWALCDRRLVLDGGRLVSAGPWRFGAGGEQELLEHHLRVPFLVDVWRRLGRPTATAPRTVDEAAEALA